MKFYEDKTYIEMCRKAVQYLGNKLEDGQRFLLVKGFYGIGEPAESGREWIAGEVAFYSEEHNYLEGKEYVPVWSQDQLQRMIIDYAVKEQTQWEENYFTIIANYPTIIFDKFVDYKNRKDTIRSYYFSNRDTCFEIAWLCYLMEYLYNKQWNGKEWV